MSARHGQLFAAPSHADDRVCPSWCARPARAAWPLARAAGHVAQAPSRSNERRQRPRESLRHPPTMCRCRERACVVWGRGGAPSRYTRGNGQARVLRARSGGGGLLCRGRALPLLPAPRASAAVPAASHARSLRRCLWMWSAHTTRDSCSAPPRPRRRGLWSGSSIATRTRGNGGRTATAIRASPWARLLKRGWRSGRSCGSRPTPRSRGPLSRRPRPPGHRGLRGLQLGSSRGSCSPGRPTR